MTPETKARIEIDRKLTEAGYVVQDFEAYNPTASLGVAVREYPTSSGPVDYLIFINQIPCGVIEAKKTQAAESLTSVAEQSKRYIESELKFFKSKTHIRFAYEATDLITHFCDYDDEKARSREVFTFHRPETLLEWMKSETTLRNRLKSFPELPVEGFRKCQRTAILNLEKSFGENRPRAVIQMATGAGKTYTAITNTYRLLKNAKAKRILFLVDTKNLGEQAEEEFKKYKPYDDARLFPELYNVCRLNKSFIPESTHVCISTIQRMYSILRGEELDESLEDEHLTEKQLNGNPKEVSYNAKYPIEFFDFIIIDECHRSIYNLWQQVLDYFDAFLIGLTATPDKRTFGFFNENVVSEYPHEKAVIDGVNVGRDGTYLIETDITAKGGIILKQVVEKRNRLSRKKRWEQLDEDINYAPSRLDRDVVNPSQIRNIIKAFKEKAQTEIFPERINPTTKKWELPKTLIFAKTDSHADDIIKIVREEFGEGNDFCKKITYGSAEDPKSVLSAFRNEYNPRIAVTVDMIATGTDVKPIECLVFMRDVRSANYFEQMKGRATRTLSKDGLQTVTPSATTQKLGYVLVDAVGVTKSHKTTSRQLERKPYISLKDLMKTVIFNKDEDSITSLASRLIKLDKIFTPFESEQVRQICGKTLPELSESLLNAFDADKIFEKASSCSGCSVPTEEQQNEARQELIEIAVNPFYDPKLRDYLEKTKKNHDQVIDTVNIDSVTFAGWDSTQDGNADNTINTFRQFIEENKDEITALSIIYNQSYKMRPLTFKMIDELYEAMQKPPYRLSIAKLWYAYTIKDKEKVKAQRVEDKLADIVSLIRYALGQIDNLTIFSSDVNLKFQAWVFEKNAGHGQFSEEQMEWLRMIRDHIAVSAHIDAEDLDLTPFDKKGGLGKFYQLFGDEYEQILEEMNYVLVA
ncbi:MAG: DEAD/DEAH box helicase [Ruminococcaceae bacterium]|nr:DEAD/DEAH box helicase [Oscillospiraceae bacterium]